MNNSEEEFETIIRNTEEPKKVREDRNEHIKTKEAKLTGRTKDSLKKKIKDRTLLKLAFAKYNKYYSKMHDSASRVVRLQRAQENGKDISDKRIEKRAAEVSAYSKKLAKWAVRVLDDDIKEIAMSKKAKVRRVRTPMKLVEKLRRFSWTRILRARDEAKIKRDTKEFIKQSVNDAFYKDEYSDDVKRDEKAQGQLMRDLSLSEKGDKLSTLRGFIVKNDKEGDPWHLTEPVHRPGSSNTSRTVDEEEKSKTQNQENAKKDSEDVLAALARKKLEAERSTESTKNSNPIFEAIAKSQEAQAPKGGDQEVSSHNEQSDKQDSLNNDVSIKEAQESIEVLKKCLFSDNPSLQKLMNEFIESIEEKNISNGDKKSEVVNSNSEPPKTAAPLATEQVLEGPSKVDATVPKEEQPIENPSNESLDKPTEEKGSPIQFSASPASTYSESNSKASDTLTPPVAMENVPVPKVEQPLENSSNGSLDRPTEEKGLPIQAGSSPDRAYSGSDLKTFEALTTPAAMENLIRRREEAQRRLADWSAKEDAAQKRLDDANKQLQSENETHKKCISYAEQLKEVLAVEDAAFRKEHQVRDMVTKAEELEKKRANVFVQSQDINNEVTALEKGRKR